MPTNLENLRDDLAMRAMQGLLSGDRNSDRIGGYFISGRPQANLLARDAYDIADAMLAERTKRDPV